MTFAWFFKENLLSSKYGEKYFNKDTSIALFKLIKRFSISYHRAFISKSIFENNKRNKADVSSIDVFRDISKAQIKNPKNQNKN